jgi:glycosyltransferase involved in cell wall biosynthesis
MPTYNHARYLAATLESVLAQSWRPLEIVVADDASTDETPAVLAAYANRVRSVRLERNCGGPARPRNAAIALSRGELIAIFDSDDLMIAGNLDRKVDFLRRFADIPLVFGDFEHFYDDGRNERFLPSGHAPFHDMVKEELASGEYRIRSAHAFETLVADNFVGTSGIVMRRSLPQTVGGFDESLCNADDRDFLLRVSRRFNLGFIDAVLHRHRVHPANISSRPAALQARQTVLERLRDAGLSGKARASLAERLSELYFSRGYLARLNGDRALALRFYLKSWSLKKYNLRTIKSALRALLPY